jgi:protein SCO1/2
VLVSRTALAGPRGRRRARGLLAAPAAAVLAAAALVGCGGGGSTATTTLAPQSAQQFEGAPLPGGMSAPAFTLADAHGSPVALADSRGQVTVLAFLDSRCRACVLIAQQIRGALDELGHPVPVLLVSVDPAADTPASVRRFLQQVSLSGRARYLVGPPAALAAAWRHYRVRTPATGVQAFEQAAPVLLIDRSGRERVIYDQEQLTPEALAHDIGILQGPPQPG